jgi:hypothetical protein
MDMTRPMSQVEHNTLKKDTKKHVSMILPEFKLLGYIQDDMDNELFKLLDYCKHLLTQNQLIRNKTLFSE